MFFYVFTQKMCNKLLSCMSFIFFQSFSKEVQGYDTKFTFWEKSEFIVITLLLASYTGIDHKFFCWVQPLNTVKDVHLMLVVLGFNATLTAMVISWRSVTHMFPGFLTPVLTQLFFPKPPTTFLTCFCRREKRNTPQRKFASSGEMFI